MAADERDGGLFVSLHQMLCHFYPVAQTISSCDDFSSLLGSATLTHLVLDTGEHAHATHAHATRNDTHHRTRTYA